MKGEVYGYIRVSCKDQNEDRQVLAMESFGVLESHMIIEKQSGKDFNRPQYQKLMSQLTTGDTLVIKSIDRLGRNYDEIIEQWRILTKEKHVSIVVLDMPLLDTRKERDLMGVLISDIVLQLLSYVAQTEREFIHQRQAEGIAAAKAKGVKFGPQRKKVPDNFSYYAKLWYQGDISSRQAASHLGMSYQTFLRRVKEIKYI
ncbi:recombinase family protein [Candidatus Stoquefichus massiliensis]|uniref:recombinase family protein n=1 Tax=Candidatus Stoquefichus massiliensis TaxID=1470350 RepID=UPI000480C1A0|nr:recombinase family protein [Candidatus Stoquefichus massiliensis]